MLLFGIAFFLPACRGAGGFQGTMPGYWCAGLTLGYSRLLVSTPYYQLLALAAKPGHRLHAEEISALCGPVLLSVSGWVNPLILFYLLSLVWTKIRKLRMALGVGALACLATAWATVVWSKLLIGINVRPLVGHYLWTVGILLMLAPEALRFGPARIKSCA